MSAYYIQAHIRPALRLGVAIQSAGHDVRVASARPAVRYIEAAGLTPMIVDGEIDIHGPLPSRETEEAARKAHTEVFPRWVEGLHRCAEEWRPDVIVREWSELAGMVVADRLGIPCVVSGIMLRLPPDVLVDHACTLILDPKAYTGLMAGWGLGDEWPEERFRARFHGDLWLSPYPASLAYPGTELAHERHLQPLLFDAIGGEAEELPAWLRDLGDEPLVNVTMGTTFNHVPKVFETVIDALAGLDLRLVATIGPDRDPAEFAPLPPNVHVERYIAQSVLFPNCRAVLMHGGFTSMLAALTHGIPIGFLPLGADQALNAARCVELGAGLSYPRWAADDGDVLRLDSLDAGLLRTMTSALLEDPAIAGAANRIRAEIRHLPTPEAAVPWIEALVGA